MKSLMAVSVMGANDVPDRYVPAAALVSREAEELPDDAGAAQPKENIAHARTSSAIKDLRLSALMNIPSSHT